MRIAPLKEVKDRFSEYVEAAQTSPVIVTRNGKPVVVMSAIDNDSDLDTLFLASSSRFVSMLEEADARITATGGLHEDEFWAQVDKDIAAPRRRTAARLKRVSKPAKAKSRRKQKP